MTAYRNVLNMRLPILWVSLELPLHEFHRSGKARASRKGFDVGVYSGTRGFGVINRRHMNYS